MTTTTFNLVVPTNLPCPSDLGVTILRNGNGRPWAVELEESEVDECAPDGRYVLASMILPIPALVEILNAVEAALAEATK